MTDLTDHRDAAGERVLPDRFLLGAAAAAYQIEGAAAEDGRTASIWDAFSAIPGATAAGETGAVACDHYHRYREDVALMKELGLQSYRFSTSWARVRPDGGAVNAAGLDFYSRLVDELLDAGIRPWLTLYHWDLPQALEERGGWASRDTVERYTEFALSVHDALGDRVTDWTTFNEPWCSAFLGYVGGQHAPGRREPAAGLAAAHHLLLAHGTVVRELRRRDADLQLGITLNLGAIRAADPTSEADLDAARRIDGQFNRIFLDPLLRGAYPQDLLADVAHLGFDRIIRDGDLEVISQPIDFLGVNYYHREVVGTTPPPQPFGMRAPTTRTTGSPYPAVPAAYTHSSGRAVTAMGWEVEPDGLTEILLRVHEEYLQDSATRLYVTENGAAYDDEVGDDGSVDDPERAAFLGAHLHAVLDAVDRGAPVDGYFYWSLMDNYEWAWGYDKRFGIVHVDYPTQRRTVKSSGHLLADIIARRSVASALAPQESALSILGR
ncbi:GH1 family beta-glucosidase [Microbacterium sp. NPDC058342]|uniref:GH1 family beta-glucosidase n=1 Tax=Microbacterium sp. NPDC058342 TaxID=3346454 RepID=UPI00365D1680